jgi:hypothetical protein
MKKYLEILNYLLIGAALLILNVFTLDTWISISLLILYSIGLILMIYNRISK